MSASPLSRRAFLIGGGASLLAACATSPEVSPAVAALPVRRIVFANAGNRAYRVAAEALAEWLPRLLGARYQPKARDGLTVTITFRNLILADTTSWGRADRPLLLPWAGDTALDILDADIGLSRRRETVASFRFFASAIPQINVPYDFAWRFDPGRVRALARAYAYWLVQKLGTPVDPLIPPGTRGGTG